MARHDHPIIVMSFNRPDYLRTVLLSLKAQSLAVLAERKIALFQDGNYNPFSKKSHSDPNLAPACVEVFKELFPAGEVRLSDVNLGVALNFDRAERFVFEELGAEAAIFLEDDLELSEHYIDVLDNLLAANCNDERVGYLAAYGDHQLSTETQRSNSHALAVLHHNWGFAVYRRQWERMRPYTLQYLEFVRDCDYGQRDHEAIKRLFASWGFSPPATSQDAAKTTICCVIETLKLNTVACFARYIGEQGLHMNTDEFFAKNYRETRMLAETVTEFEPVTDNLATSVRNDLRRWAGDPSSYLYIPGASGERQKLALTSRPSDGNLLEHAGHVAMASMSILEKFSEGTNAILSIEKAFHLAARYAADNRIEDAARSGATGLVKLFGTSPAFDEIRAHFYPLADIRDVARESHIRLDFRAGAFRILCPIEMLKRNFTNYFEGFTLVAAIVSVVSDNELRSGGITVELGGAAAGSFSRVSFSSNLPQASLIIDPEFFRSNGYQHLRELLDKESLPWRDRLDLAFWRGKTTGSQVNPPGPTDKSITSFEWLPRLQLCALAANSPNASKLDVGITSIVQIESSYLRLAAENAGFIRKAAQVLDVFKYKFCFIIDSNTSEGNGLFQALLSGTCVLLVDSRSGFRSWFYDKLSPWETHIPIRADFSNFEERIQWAFDNYGLCELMADKGQRLAEALTFNSECAFSARQLQAQIRA